MTLNFLERLMVLSSARCVLFGIVVAHGLFIQSCGSELRPSDFLHQPELNLSWFQSADIYPELRRQKKLCEVTYGRWNDGLISCVCPPRSLFDAEMGCQVIDRYRPQKNCPAFLSHATRYELEQCASQILRFPSLQVNVEISSFNDRELSSISQQMDEDWTALIQGLTITRQKKAHKNIWYVTSGFETTLEGKLSLHGRACPDRLNMLVTTPHMVLQPSHLNRKKPEDPCLSSLESSGSRSHFINT